MSLSSERWRWPEEVRLYPENAPGPAGHCVAGVDVGSVSTQAVVLVDGAVYATASIRTGSYSPKAASLALDRALAQTPLRPEDLRALIGTGYGRVNVPGATRTITEITCHARGARQLAGPGLRTLLDMGGQDCKVIRLDESGKVADFLMNDKCAAGTGRGMEVMADLLDVPITEIGPRSLDIAREPEPVSSTCVLFAKTEALGRLKRGDTQNEVLAAYCAAMAKRVVALIRRLGFSPEFFITGGIAKNSGVVTRIERELGVGRLTTDFDTQLVGALGAALFAFDSARCEERP